MAAFCRSQAVGAWGLLGRLVGHDPLPKTLKGTAGAGAGCCLFPFASFAIWLFVIPLWAAAALTLGSYALLMSLGWGVGALLPHRKVALSAPPPPPPRPGGLAE